MQGGCRQIHECVRLDGDEFEKVAAGENRLYRCVGVWTPVRSGEDVALVSVTDEWNQNDGELEDDEDVENRAATDAQGQDRVCLCPPPLFFLKGGSSRSSMVQ